MRKLLGNLPLLLSLVFVLAFFLDAPFLHFVKEARLWGWWFVILVPLTLFIIQLSLWIALPWARPLGGRLDGSAYPRGSERAMPAILALLLAAGAAGPIPRAEATLAALTCNRSQNARLEDTNWALVDLEGTRVDPDSPERRPYLVLQSQSHRALGSGGCNRYSGSYRLEKGTITFSEVIATKMACSESMDVETAYFTALNDVKSWRVKGDSLELKDAAGKTMARFTTAGEPR